MIDYCACIRVLIIARVYASSFAHVYASLLLRVYTRLHLLVYTRPYHCASIRVFICSCILVLVIALVYAYKSRVNTRLKWLVRQYTFANSPCSYNRTNFETNGLPYTNTTITIILMMRPLATIELKYRRLSSIETIDISCQYSMLFFKILVSIVSSIWYRYRPIPTRQKPLQRGEQLNLSPAFHISLFITKNYNKITLRKL